MCVCDGECDEEFFGYHTGMFPVFIMWSIMIIIPIAMPEVSNAMITVISAMILIILFLYIGCLQVGHCSLCGLLTLTNMPAIVYNNITAIDVVNTICCMALSDWNSDVSQPLVIVVFHPS